MAQTIVLSMTEEVDAGILDQLRADLAEATGFPVVAGPTLAISPDDRDARWDKYRSSLILHRMPAVPPDELLLLITTVNIYAGNLGFVYGSADPANRRAVVSTARLAADPVKGPASPEQLRTRLLTEALHELGHLRGLEHCDDPACAMAFSFNLYDADRRRPAYCTPCGGLLVP